VPSIHPSLCPSSFHTCPIQKLRRNGEERGPEPLLLMGQQQAPGPRELQKALAALLAD